MVYKRKVYTQFGSGPDFTEPVSDDFCRAMVPDEKLGIQISLVGIGREEKR